MQQGYFFNLTGDIGIKSLGTCDMAVREYQQRTGLFP